MKEEIERMLKEGIIKKSKSPWASPVVLVSKKDGSIRFCIDYKKVNDLTIVDAVNNIPSRDVTYCGWLRLPIRVLNNSSIWSARGQGKSLINLVYVVIR